MTTGPGERFGAVWAWPETGGAWRYLPCAPSPQRGDSGRANVTVMEAGGMVMLTVGARLAVDEAGLAAARGAIAARLKVAETAVDLRPAEALVTAASLRIAGGGELATARPSNLPPYSTAFSAMLSGDAAAAAKAALTAGRLIVRYEVSLSKRLVARATVRGDWTGEGSLDAALETARLVIRIEADDGASEALVARVMRRARQEAQDAASRTGREVNTNNCSPDAVAAGLEIDVTDTEVVPQVLVLEGDVAGWIK